MRGLLSLVALLIVLAVVGVLVKRQLGAVGDALAPAARDGSAPVPAQAPEAVRRQVETLMEQRPRDLDRAQ
ncbi:MAG: hypothetical protein RBS40_15445 [Rhodocyclaceae bacterium]|jgi:hypothetical protein|nr:hypothetical protein [Rhodocyclaceae bacterium]